MQTISINFDRFFPQLYNIISSRTFHYNTAKKIVFIAEKFGKRYEYSHHAD